MIRSTYLALAALLALGGAAHGAGSSYSDPLVSAASEPDFATHPRAVPACYGFGCSASIGSTYDVYWINSGDDDAPNPTDTKITLRECVEARPINTVDHVGNPVVLAGNRARYCLFRYSGYIKLRSKLIADVAKLHIAGQTSANGVEITFDAAANYTNSTNPHKYQSLLEIRTNDVIVEHLRIRGNTHTAPANQSDSVSAILISAGERIVIRHNSLSYTTDQVMTVYGGKNISIIKNVIGPMLCSATNPLTTVGHSEVNHCRPMFVNPGKNVTVAFNMIGWGDQRGLNVSGGNRLSNGTPLANEWGQIDAISNFIYFFNTETGLMANEYGHTFVNLVNNIMWKGPRFNTSVPNYPIVVYNKQKNATAGGGGDDKGFQIYHTGNSFFRNTPAITVQAAAPNTEPVCGITAGSNPPTTDCSITGLSVVSTTTPAVAPENVGLNGDGISIIPADRISTTMAAKQILAYGGATACRTGFYPVYCRDSIDKLAVANTGVSPITGDVYTCASSPQAFSSTWPTSRSAAFGNVSWPASNDSTEDTDVDGVPDSAEIAYSAGMNVLVYDGNADADGDGYTNLQEWLSYVSGEGTLYDEHRTNPYGSITVPANNCGWPLSP